MFPFSKPYTSIVPAEESLDSTHFAKLGLLGGLNTQPVGVSKVLYGVNYLLMYGSAILSFLTGLTLMFLLPEMSEQKRQELSSEGFYAFLIMVSIWAIGFVIFYVGTIRWYIGMRRWRRNLAKREVGLHLAMAPHGGSICAEFVRWNWWRYFRRTLLPPVVLFLALSSALLMGMHGMGMLMPVLIENSITVIYALIYTFLMVHGILLLGVAALTFVGSTTARNWVLLILLLFSGQGDSPQEFFRANSSNPITHFQIDFYLHLIVNLCLILICWALILWHFRNVEKNYLSKLIREVSRIRPNS